MNAIKDESIAAFYRNVADLQTPYGRVVIPIHVHTSFVDLMREHPTKEYSMSAGRGVG